MSNTAKQIDIVIIPFHDYKKWISEGFRTRDAHLAEHFCNDDRVRKVLVINRPTSLAEIILKRKSWKTQCSGSEVIIKKKDAQIVKFNSKMYCLDMYKPDTLRVIKERKMWWFSAFQSESVIESIRWAIDKLNLNNTVLLLQNPMAIGVVDNLSYDCFAFDAIDNWLYHPQMKSNHAVIEENYKFVENNADTIFTVSNALVETFKSNKNVHWMPNGVDTDYFQSAIKSEILDKIKIGYVGKIQERVDFDIVEECLKRFPNYIFVFMGPVFSQKKRIKDLGNLYSNVTFTGDIHYKDLPNKLKDIDVAIIPHRIDEFTDSMNPLKLYEYLAAGKCVVTTQVAGTAQVSPYVFETSVNGFVDMLEGVIDKYKKGALVPEDIRNSLPLEYSWTYRSKMILNVLEHVLESKQGDE